jgi:hypothetical protein
MRPVHHVTIRSVGRPRILCLEPWGMELELAPDDELLIEVIGVDPPALDIGDHRVTCWHGVGSEIRVLHGETELYSSIGHPVPGVPEGMSVRGFLGLVGLTKPGDR